MAHLLKISMSILDPAETPGRSEIRRQTDMHMQHRICAASQLQVRDAPGPQGGPDPQVCCAANGSQPKPQEMLSATQILKPALKINK